jgi:hypothetical protein
MTAGANDNLVAAALALLRPLAAHVGTVGELARSLARFAQIVGNRLECRDFSKRATSFLNRVRKFDSCRGHLALCCAKMLLSVDAVFL